MIHEDYKEKLHQFNSSKKYEGEMKTLIEFMDPKSYETILDYGAGTGFMAEHIRASKGSRVYAYDVHGDYYEGDPFYFRTELYFRVDKIYLMHSFAHIADPYRLLITLRDKFLNPGGSIYILTPNREWIDENKKPDYIPDPTVIKHYTSSDIYDICEDLDTSNIRIKYIGNGERLMIRLKF